MKIQIDWPALWRAVKAESYSELKAGLKEAVTSEGSSAHKAEFTTTVPRVNLLPPEAIDRDQAITAKRMAVAVVAGAAVLAGGWWGAGFLDQSLTRADLQAVEAEGAVLSADLAIYSPVFTLAGQSESLTATVEAQAQEIVAHEVVIDALLDAAGNRVDLTRVTVTVDGSGAGCVQTDPFSPSPLIGCISFSGVTDDGHSGAAALISALQGDDRFADPFIPSTAENSYVDGEATINGTVGLTMNAYVHQPEADSDELDADTGVEDEGEGDQE